MGADRWSVCPRCERRHRRKAVEANAAVHAEYGKLPLEDWLALEADAKKADQPFVEHEMREDWEVSSPEEGEVTFSYSASCRVCGLSVSIEHAETIPGLND